MTTVFVPAACSVLAYGLCFRNLRFFQQSKYIRAYTLLFFFLFFGIFTEPSHANSNAVQTNQTDVSDDISKTEQTSLNINSFDIPALPLNQALSQLSDQSEVSFLVNYDLVDDKVSTAIKGTYTIQKALDLLLKGSGLQGQLTQHNIFIITAGDDKEALHEPEFNSAAAHSIANTDINHAETMQKDEGVVNKVVSFLLSGTKENQDHTQEPQNDFESLERILITGSYIKRASYFDTSSPIDFFNRAALDADIPNGRLVDSLRFMTMNAGNFSGLAPGGDGGAQEGRLGAGTINLRGLGGGATLVLTNGQRHAGFPLASDRRVDVNSLTPSIMLKNIEVLKDGASAVYGSDAVAGVVNFITRSDFEGIEMRIDGRGTYGATVSAFDHHNYTLGLLIGTERNALFKVVAGFEYFNQDNLVFGEVAQVPVFTSQGASSFGNPGSYILPMRDEAGIIVADTTVADPFCQDVIDANISMDPNFAQTPTSLDSDANLCRITFPNQAFLLDEERFSGRLETRLHLSKDTSFRNTLAYTRSVAGDIFNATAPVLNFPTVLGEHPNNPFRAVNSLGQTLFAQDANSDGLADRDENGSVILDPNGIPFNEDVLFRGRPYSATNYGVVSAEQEINTFRSDFSFDGMVNDVSWELGLHYAQQELIRRAPDSVFSEFQNALLGLGGPEQNLYFNPFGSSILDPTQANDPILVDSIQVMLYDRHKSQVTTLDGLVSTDLYQLSAGPLSVALGFQLRKEALSQNFDLLKNIGQVSFFGNGDIDFSASDKVGAAFFEAVAPIADLRSGSIDMSVAGRYEYNTQSNSSTLNPKINLRYRSDVFALNASYATSFLAPSLFQRGGVIAQFANVDDPISGTSEQVSTRIIGNESLNDQESTSISLGLNLTPSDATVIDLTYWRFDFVDLIAASSTQTIVSADPTGPLVTRDESNIISLVERPFFNAGAIETDGVDIKIDHLLTTKALGRFNLSAQATYVNQYNVQDEKNGPVIDGVGSDNNGNIGTAMAKWRANMRILWTKEQHSAGLTFRYYSEIERIRGRAEGIADATWVLDAKYSYLLETETADILLSMGARNLLNNEPNIVLTTDNQYFIGNYQDPAGRVIFANAQFNF